MVDSDMKILNENMDNLSGAASTLIQVTQSSNTARM
jgi:hypothetical protein